MDSGNKSRVASAVQQLGASSFFAVVDRCLSVITTMETVEVMRTDRTDSKMTKHVV